MLGKKYRLPIQTFRQKKGVAQGGTLFSLKAFSPAEDFSRFGVILRKKVIKTAAKRNQIQRIVFDFVYRSQNDIKDIKDYLLISLPKLENVNGKHDIINELKNLFNLK